MLFKKLKYWLVLALLTGQILIASAAELPDLKEERLIGQIYLQYLRQENKISSDSIINDYLNHLGTKLALSSGNKAQHFNFFAVNADDINAYAFFGGNIGIHLGLIANTSNESELAAVIAHEISHINQKHLLRQMIEQKKLMPLTVLGALGAMVIGNPGLGTAALAHHTQQMINFTREHEKEADYLGMQILYKAGFDPDGMPNIFANMQTSNRYQVQAPEYLLTHPLYESRISDAKNRAHQFPYKQINSDLNYYLIRARAIVTINHNLHNLKQNLTYQIKTGKYNNKAAIEYTYALCLINLGKAELALEILQSLATTYPENLVLNLSLAELQAQTNNLSSSIKILKYLYSLYPEASPVLLSLAEKMLLSGQYKIAKTLLIKQTILFPQDPQGFELLAQTENKLNNKQQMHIAKSKWYLINGELENAILQLDLALQNNKDQRLINKLKQEQQNIEKLIQKQKNL